MKINQLTVFVENRTGYLSEITELLGKKKIDMKALSIADTKEFGILRVIVNDVEKARDILSAQGIICKITQVVEVKISDKPGELSSVLSVLSKNGVGVDYLYAFLSADKDGANVVIKATDNDAAEKILNDAGFKTIND